MLTNAFFKTRTDGKELSNSSMIGRSSETEFTVSLWGFASGLIQSYGQGIYTINGSFYNTNNPGGVFQIFIFPGGGVKVQTGAGGVGGQLVLANADSPIEMNKWFHLMLVLENNTLNIFVNGQDKTSLATITGTISTMPSLLSGAYKNYMLGYYNSTAYSWQGSVVHIAQWDSDKSSNISTIYNNGQPGDLTSLSPKNWWKLTDGSLVDSGSEADNAVALSTLPNVVATNVSSNSKSGTSSGMTTANLVTSDLNRSLLYSSYSMNFDASSGDKITGTGALISGNDSRSFSLWYKTTTTTPQIPFSLGSPTDQTNGAQFAYCINRSSTTNAAIFGKNSAYDTSVFTVPNTSDGEWHHLLVTYDQSSLKVYLDGNLEATPALPSTSYITSAGFTIGGWTMVGNRLFNGKISNVSVWNSALSENEILTIYNGGAPNDISSLSPVSWWSLSGDSYYNGSNWICPDLSTNSNNGTSANMDATNLVGNAPGSTSNGTGTNMNIPGNLEGNAPNSDKNAYSVNMVATNRDTSVPDISS